MKNLAQSLTEDIELASIKEVIEHGVFIFINTLGFSIIFVLVLWPYADHAELLLWFAACNLINLISRTGFHIYQKHIYSIKVSDIDNIKLFLFLSTLLSGICWGSSSLLFLDPEQTNTLLIVSVSIFFVSTTVILSLFSYLPAVLIFIISAGGVLIFPLLLHEDRALIDIGLVLGVTLVFCIIGCIKVGRSFRTSIRLNLENIELHKDRDEKSLLLETALENIDQGISMTDQQDQLRMWNKQFIKLIGLKEYQISNHQSLESILLATTPPLSISQANRIHYKHDDGRSIEIRQNFLEQGGRVLTYTDISDLIEREQALEQARKTAEQVNAAKTRFLAAASHDLRQPIHALGLFFAELSDRIATENNELLIAQIEDSINTINSMLNALLDVSKLDAGVIKPKIESFSLKSMFARLSMDFVSIAAETHNQLTIRPTDLAVTSDATLLESILRNLIGNALRYTNHGRVLVAARKQGNNINIQVYDNGPGIPENQLEEIFIEFHQLDNPARDRRKGLGLGLAIVKRLADLLDHQINVKSIYGQGCCFTFTLASAPKPAPNKIELPGYSKAYEIDKRQILVLDDDEAVLSSIEGLLKRWGCQVSAVKSSTQAWAKIKQLQLKPELLIVDYRLPEQDTGITIAKNIIQSLPYPAAALIVTGDTGPDMLQEAQHSGFPLLHKPVQPAKLRSTIEFLFNSLNQAGNQQD